MWKTTKILFYFYLTPVVMK